MASEQGILPPEELEPPPAGMIETFDNDVPEDAEDDDFGGPNQPQTPPRRRGRPKMNRNNQQHVPFNPPGRLATNAELIATEDIDAWGTKFDWSVPGMKMQLHRKAPPFFQGVKTQGYLEEKDQAAYTLQEIRSRFGGGDYEVVVLGPVSVENPLVRPINRKRFVVAGNPRIDGDGIPEEVRYAAPGSPGGRGAFGRQPSPAQDGTSKAMVEILGDQLQALNQRAFAPPVGGNPKETMMLKDAYAEATKLVMSAAEGQAAAKEAAAAQLTAIHQQAAARLEGEKRQLEKERDELRERITNVEASVQTKIAEASNGGIGLLAQLLPTFSSSTQEQVRLIISQYEAREERQAAQYQSQINAMHSAHDAQMKTLSMQHEVQMKVIESTFNNNLTLLKGQIQNLEAEKAHLQRQLDDSRRMFDEARKELMTHIQTAKQQPDSIDQLSKMAQLREVMETIWPRETGPAAEEGIADGIDNPALKSIFKMGDKLVPHLPAILDAFKGRQQQPPGYPPAGYPPPGYPPPPQMMPPQQMMPQQMPQQMVPQQQMPQQMPQPPRRPQPKKQPPPKNLLKKEDVIPALQLLSGVLAQPEPPPPEAIVQVALQSTNHSVLRVLCERDPENVVMNLDAAGLLKEHPNLDTEKGKAYIVELLKVLKPHLG